MRQEPLVHAVEVTERRAGRESLLHKVKDVVHTGALQLRQDIGAFEHPGGHLVVWFDAADETGTLRITATLTITKIVVVINRRSSVMKKAELISII